ncbi:unnamed protein product [Microthlaspi erraticum]|uniref:Uncharacterized protein n=1 Tax=Microthlaspi erraticum TaxID=1685480 RepID=A0A6D2IQB2_9BRAS|nr:unnamed protein product [Microthlaspi erraticum]
MGVEEGIYQTYIPSPHRFHRRACLQLWHSRLPVYVGGISKLLKFIVMDKPAIYNAILGTPWLHEMKPSSRLSTSPGIFTLRGDQRVTRSCFLRERKLRTASSFMIAEPSNQQPREESSRIV